MSIYHYVMLIKTAIFHSNGQDRCSFKFQNILLTYEIGWKKTRKNIPYHVTFENLKDFGNLPRYQMVSLGLFFLRYPIEVYS